MSKFMLTKALLGLFLILGLCVAGWWVLRDSGKTPANPFLLWADEPASSDPVTNAIEAELLDGNYAEAHGWLNEPGHILVAGSAHRVNQLIDDLYTDGAEQVWFVGMEPLEEENGIAASMMVARLPTNEQTRARLLQHHAAFLGQPQPDPDTGQKYLVFYFE